MRLGAPHGGTRKRATQHCATPGVYGVPTTPQTPERADDQARACCHSRIIRRSVWLGARKLCTSASPVIGLVDLVASQRSIADRSYECPSAAITGSLMSSVVIGQTKSCGGSASFAAGVGEPHCCLLCC